MAQHVLKRARALSLGLVLIMVGSLVAADVEVRFAAADPAAPSGDIITTVAGNGSKAFAGDGGPATEASLNAPAGVASGAAGTFYVADKANDRIRKVDAGGAITTVAGGGSPATGLGDGGAATAARLRWPGDVAVDPDGDLYIADTLNDRIRKVDASGVITTVAGGGLSTPVEENSWFSMFGGYARSEVGGVYPGDGGKATDALLKAPGGVALDGLGNIYIADTGYGRVRKVDTDGLITTVAGGGVFDGPDAEGRPATEAYFSGVEDVVVDRDGNVYLSDQNHYVWTVGTNGILTRVAGDGTYGYGGDNGPATAAQFAYPEGLALDSEGTLYIADSGNHRVRRVDTLGTVTTVAGNGTAGYSGDGGPATEAQLRFPAGLDIDPSGALRIADAANHRIRRAELGLVDWTITIDDSPDPLAVGATLTYTVTVGAVSADLPSVVVDDPLPSDVSLVSVTPSQGGCTAGASNVNCILGRIERGSTATVAIVVTVNAVGVLTNTVTVTVNEFATKSAVAQTRGTDPACGQQVMQSTVITADIGPCAGDGLVIAADGVTVDLGGHHIFGFPGPEDGTQAGVRLTKGEGLLGVSGVTVTNGTVSQFDAGVVVEAGASNTVTGLTVRDNVGPDNPFSAELGDGIVLFDSANNTITNNTVVRNGIFDGIGVLGSSSDGNTIAGNTVTDTLGPSDGGPAGQGIIVSGFLDDSDRGQTITGSRVSGNTILRSASAGNANVNNINSTIEDNIVEDNGRTNSVGNGIGVQMGPGTANNLGSNVVVQRNEVHRNGVDGIRVTHGGTRIVDNDASDNNANPQVNWYESRRRAHDLRDLSRSAGSFVPDCSDNVWSGNVWGSGGYSPECTAASGSGPNPPTTAASADFDGDGDTDISVFRPASGSWFPQGGTADAWGTEGDIAVPADYEGLAGSEVAVFRPSSGIWFVKGGATTAWGTEGDLPVPGDYDGDFKADLAVFRPSTGAWYIHPSGAGADRAVGWGTQGDIPVPGDYNGDGTTEIAVFRPSSGTWFVQGGATVAWGTQGDVPVPGDYDANGTTDIAVFRPSSGTWFVNGGATTNWGTAGDIPTPGDFDGNASADIAVFRPSSGTWFVNGGATTNWGTAGDQPLPLPAAIRQTLPT